MENKNNNQQGSSLEDIGVLIAAIIVIAYGTAIGIKHIIKHIIKFIVFLSKRLNSFSAIHSPFPKPIREAMKIRKENQIIESIHYNASYVERNYRLLLKLKEVIEKDEADKYNSLLKQFIEDKENIKAKYNEEKCIAEQNLDLELLDQKRSRKLIKEKLNKNYIKEKKDLKETFDSQTTQILSCIAEIIDKNKIEWLRWKDPYWEKYELIKKTMNPPLTRIGEFKLKEAESTLTVPALLPIISHKNVLIKASGNSKKRAFEAINALILRLLVTIPPGRVNFTLVAPGDFGTKMAVFKHLPGKLVGKKIWNGRDQIKQQLNDLSEHIETIIQNHLKNDYPNIEDYNKKAGEIAEPYRILVVEDFPYSFDEETTEILIRLARNGVRAGVHVIILRDMDQKITFKSEFEELESLSIIIRQEKNQFVWEDDDFRTYPLILDKLPPKEITNGLLKVIGDKSKSASRVIVPISLVLERTKKWWALKSDQGIRVPIGLSSARTFQYLDIGKGTKQHPFIGGTTGSGKSVLLHDIIIIICINYSPDEVELYLMDFKKGVEFKPYAEKRLPHARVIAIQSEREFGLSVLQKLDVELQYRGDLFRKIGARNLAQFRQLSSEKIPRIVLIIDEYQELFKEDDFISSQSSLFLDRLIRQGRALGIHVLLSSQTIGGGNTLPRTTIDQMGIRIALQCEETESRLILGDENPAAARLTRSGEAIYNDGNGSVEENKHLQAFMISKVELDKCLDALQKLQTSRGPVERRPLTIFEGTALSNIESNEPLHECISVSTWSEKHSRLFAWLGDPIAIKEHTFIEFRRESRANLLIIGKNEGSAAAMLISSIVSLATQKAPEDIEFHVIDLSRDGSNWNVLIAAMPDILPHKMNLYKAGNVTAIIEKILKLLKKREKTGDEWAGQDIFLCFLGLHRARNLKSNDGYTYPEEAEKLWYILNNGPDFGIHTICWGDTIKNLERIIDRNKSEFSLRVILQMNLQDSNYLIDSDDGSKLGPYIAAFYDEDGAGNLEKFRPYSLPSQAWIESIGVALKKKSEKIISPKVVKLKKSERFN